MPDSPTKDSKIPSLLVIGGGHMGGAIIRGLLHSPVSARQRHVTLVERRADIRHSFEQLPLEILDGLPSDVSQFQYILICVKPRDLPVIGSAIAGRLDPQSTVMSILAGSTITEIENNFQFRGAVIRAMPNVAATVAESATVLCCNEYCTSEQRETAEGMFAAVGQCWWLDETLFDAVTGLSGSGPAFIYVAMDALTDAGVKVGIPRDLARQLVAQTVFGSAALARQSSLPFVSLKDQVTTPGGTAIHGLHELEKGGIRQALISAVEAARDRSAWLAKKS